MPDINLQASDGHVFSAHRVDPLETSRGGVVVVQEIFGVNAHIRAVAARFAAAGHTTLAPALFDRAERGVELGYDAHGFTRGRELIGMLDPTAVLEDLDAAVTELAREGLPVAIVGYCWGGSVVWNAAHRRPELACAIAYYGSRIVGFMDERPQVPTMMHVGRRDASLPLAKVHAIAERYPEIAIHEYDAGHGFDCDHRGDFDSTASAHAMTRSLAFLSQHMRR
jgi:carboxymethylenebutenolidase